MDENWPKNGSKKCLIFSSSTKIFWNPGTRDFSKHVFCPSPNWLIFHFFPVPRFFKKSLATGKSRYWKKWKSSFLPVIKNLLWVASLLVPGSGRKNVKNRFLPVSLVVLLLQFYYYGSFLRKPIGDSGTGFFLKSRTGNYFKTHFLPVSPVGFFWGASRTFYYHGSPREVATLWPSQPLTLASPPGAWGLYWELIPIALCSHCPYVPIALMFPFLFEFPAWDNSLFIFCFSCWILSQKYLTLFLLILFSPHKNTFLFPLSNQ